MDANGLFELLDILGPAFSEGSLCLSVPLLAFLGCGVDLRKPGISMMLHTARSSHVSRFGGGAQCGHWGNGRGSDRLTGLRPPFLFGCCPSCEVELAAAAGLLFAGAEEPWSSSPTGEDPMDSSLSS